MDFTRIFNGMVGRDFIAAFNDNFNIADRTFLSILSTLIYKVKSTDIKEFRVIEGVVSYTMDPSPAEGEEDIRIWTPVDITQWGNINGDIENQTDLWNILQDKAAVETVETISNLLSILRSEFDTLKDNVEDDESLLNTTVNTVADIEEALRTKVNSTNIKAIRLNNSVFQWSPDGNTWYEQPVVNRIAWGHLTGDITNQTDLINRFNQINNNINIISSDVTAIENAITNIQNSLSDLDTTVQEHLIQDAQDKATINNTLSNTTLVANSANTTANSADTKIDAHLEDFNNPHQITKTTIGLDRVDNTSDSEKEISIPTKNYVDTEIAKIIDTSFDGIPIIKRKGLINHVFVGNQTMYSSINPGQGTLSFLLDDSFFKITLILYSNEGYTFRLIKDGTTVIPDTEDVSGKTYNNVLPDGIYQVGITVDGQEIDPPFAYDIPFDSTTVFKNVDDFLENSEEEPSQEELNEEPNQEEPSQEEPSQEGGNE